MAIFNPLKPLSAPRKAYSFPLDSLPPTIANYAAAVADSIAVSPDMPAALSLAVLSAALQGKAKVRYSASYIQEMNVYVCIVADPAERKSPVFRAMTAPLNIYAARYNKENAQKIQNFRDIKSALENKREAFISKGKSEDIESINAQIAELEPCFPMRVLVTDTTVEALAEALKQNNERLAILSDEGGIFDIAAGQYTNGKANINLYLNAYDGERVVIERKYGCTCLERPLLTFGVMAQRQVLNQVLTNPIFRGRGFVQRFVFSQPPSFLGKAKISRSESRDLAFIATQNEYNKLIYRLMELPCSDAFLEIDDGGAEVFEYFANQLERGLAHGGECEENRDFFGKYGGRVLRIAGLLHFADGKRTDVPINGTTMQNAVNIILYFYQQASMILNGEEQDCKDAEYLFQRIKKWLASDEKIRTERIISWHKIMQGVKNKWKDDKTQNVLDELVERGYLAEVHPNKTQYNSRAKQKYAINPLALELDKARTE